MNEITALLRIGLAAVKDISNHVSKNEDKEKKRQTYLTKTIKAFEDKIQDLEVNIEK